MWNSDQASLPAWIQDAYDDLAPHFEDPSDELSQERARELLVTESDAIDEPADADYALDRLIDRGWLYEVDDSLRKTD
ncbi:hypothetical protein SAMN05216218_1376 [Halorientalis regularis]|uniref:Uncharacterized protein n=1 Tax=Halorientalis regularis TaxID=660518 RepID=A0A1G7U3A9_9EURY|nr:hypothetical protein SAMN05216218_1376 [Halorientalis regularis]